jgi:hypothetical protein
MLLPPAKLLRDVYRIPDYRGGNAYVSTSPDGIYKGMNVYVPHEAPYDGAVSFALAFSGYDSGIVMAIADGHTARMLAYAPVDKDAFSTGLGGWWVCLDKQKGPCSLYQSSFRDTHIELPPSWWHRLVAWTAWKLRGLGGPDFGEVVERERFVFLPEQLND